MTSAASRLASDDYLCFGSDDSSCDPLSYAHHLLFNQLSSQPCSPFELLRLPSAAPRERSGALDASNSDLSAVLQGTSSGPAALLNAKERIRLTHRRFRQRKKERLGNLQKELHRIQLLEQSLADANHLLHLKNQMLDGLLQCLESDLAFGKQVAEAVGTDTPDTAELQELAALHRDSQHLTMQEHVARRHAYVRRAALLLQQIEQDPQKSEARLQLQKLNWDLQLRCKVPHPLSNS